MRAAAAASSTADAAASGRCAWVAAANRAACTAAAAAPAPASRDSPALAGPSGWPEPALSRCHVEKRSQVLELSNCQGRAGSLGELYMQQPEAPQQPNYLHTWACAPSHSAPGMQTALCCQRGSLGCPASSSNTAADQCSGSSSSRCSRGDGGGCTLNARQMQPRWLHSECQADKHRVSPHTCVNTTTEGSSW